MRISLVQILSLLGAAMLLLAAAETVQTALTLEGAVVAECAPEIHAQAYPYHLTILQVSGALLLGILLNYESSYVKGVAGRFSIRDLKRLFLGMVVAGGSVYNKEGKYCIRFYGKDLTLHHVFKDLAYEIYRSSPGTAYIPARGSYVTQLYCKDAVTEIKELSPELNRRKGGAPTISYVLEGDRSIRQEAFRVIMSVSGWISPSIRRCYLGYKVSPRLGLGSSYPIQLNEELKTLSESVSVSFNCYADSRYPETGYLMTYDAESSSRFLKMGGFIEGCAIKKGRYEGKEKNAVLMGSLALSGNAFESPELLEKALETAISNSNFELSAMLGRIMLG